MERLHFVFQESELIKVCIKAQMYLICMVIIYGIILFVLLPAAIYPFIPLLYIYPSLP